VAMVAVTGRAAVVVVVVALAVPRT